MTIVPLLDRIWIYPIKSLDGVSIPQAKILRGGALAHDREFALVDSEGKYVNGKRTAQIHLLRSQFNLLARIVTLTAPEQSPVSFHLDHARSAIEAWLSDYFGFAVFLKQDQVTGFPDDPVSPGPTIISQATLAAVAAWFPEITTEEIRSRLRTNLEISAVPAFWEDQLYSNTEQPVDFQLGAVQVQGINPCQRCIVPTRDAQTGSAWPQFQKIFSQQRQAHLPAWAPANRFNHFYRVAVNTRIPGTEAGKILRVGDRLTLPVSSSD